MNPNEREFDILVIGGGHAGVEAAWAACNVLASSAGQTGGQNGTRPGRVALVTLNPAKIGVMSCNPAIGGLAKGQMVCEVDALGGLMGLAADATGIQFKVLNQSKGPAVRGPRCQSDKHTYRDEVQRLIATRENLTVLAGSCERFVIEDGECRGIVYKPAPTDGPEEPSDGCCGEFGSIDHAEKPITLRAGAVVLTTGTFMRGLMHTGETKTPGGRVGEAPSTGISAELSRLGFEMTRLKTGTPPRLAADSLDLPSLDMQWGDTTPQPFSAMTGRGASSSEPFPQLEQVCCWITHTNERVHDLIRANLELAPMYNGQIESAGPRYCPSIEDKVVRFADRPAHQIYLEPESLSTNEIYCNGISTSLPSDVQEQMVRALVGCERAVILRPGYAVEYDAVLPHQIDTTTQTKRLPGLFLAGQINGTSGYEEAAGQGLMAGLNAARRVLGHEMIRLGRDEAYIGVMLDDLVTKTPREPYRMFTSRAEHRLVLRADNAAHRLTERAREWGLIDDDRWRVFEEDRATAVQLNEWLDTARCEVHGETQPLSRWILRSEITPDDVAGAAPEALQTALAQPGGMGILQRLLADRRYAGHVDRNGREMERLAEQENQLLPKDIDYATVKGLRGEAVHTLNRFRPATLGQAGRLAGVNPSDVMIVAVAARRMGIEAPNK